MTGAYDPIAPIYGDPSATHIQHFGITKREYFAAMAMQGMASLDIDLKDKAEASVQLADALIKELNKATSV